MAILVDVDCVLQYAQMRDSMNGSESQMLFRVAPACYADGISSQYWICNAIQKGKKNDSPMGRSQRAKLVKKYIDPLAKQALFPSHPF